MKNFLSLAVVLIVAGGFAFMVWSSCDGARVEENERRAFLDWSQSRGIEPATPVSPPTNPNTALTETLGAILRTDGWCFAATTTLQNAWTRKPARITTAQLNTIRFIKVRYADHSASTDVCVRFGPATAHKAINVDGGPDVDGGTGAPVACARNIDTSGALSSLGEFLQFVNARDAVSGSPSSPLTAPPPIWILGEGTATVCVDVGW